MNNKEIKVKLYDTFSNCTTVKSLPYSKEMISRLNKAKKNSSIVGKEFSNGIAYTWKIKEIII